MDQIKRSLGWKGLVMMTVGTILTLTGIQQAAAEINRVRVLNQTKETVYIHKGGFASAVAIPAGKWKIFYYPFSVTSPDTGKKVKTTLLVASAGGKWTTTPNGYTYLSKPRMLLCLDYSQEENQSKSGNRKWEIKKSGGFDKHCAVKGYKQPWYTENA